MGVNIQRDAHIGMSHDILQGLDVHASIRHVRAEGVPEHMGRDVRQRLVRVQLLIFLHCPAHFILNVQGNLRAVVLIQHKKTAVPVDDHLCFHVLAAGEDILQALVNLVRHRNVAAAALGFGLLYIILAAALPGKLVIYPDFPPDKVKISLCQPAKLADTHPGSQQYHKLVVILAVGFILPDEIHPKCLMLLRHRNALLRIVGNHIDQFEVKGIPTDHIFIVRHLESRFDNAPNAGEGAVSLSVLVQLHDPFLRVRNLDVPDGTIVPAHQEVKYIYFSYHLESC